MINYGRTDLPIARKQVEELLRMQFPKHRFQYISFLGEGWDYSVWDADSKYVFRFPKRLDSGKSLQTEMSSLAIIADKLPIPVPEYKLFGRPSPLFPNIFGGYEKLHGVPAPHIFIDPQITEMLAKQCGEFLNKLHSLPLELIASCEISQPLAEFHPNNIPDNAIQCFSSVSFILPGVNKQKCLEFLKNAASYIRRQSTTKVLLHFDLCPEHMLVDDSRRTISGIIDWGSSVIGDPCWDMLWLWIYYGDRFIIQLLSAYGAENQKEMFDRIKLLGVCKAIFELNLAIQTDEKEIVRAVKSALQITFPDGIK